MAMKKKRATKKSAARKKGAHKKVVRKRVVKKPVSKKRVVKKPVAKKPAVKKAAAKKPVSRRKPSAAFMKPMTPSPVLAEVVGAQAMPRTEITKKLWEYIKKNKLQDATNKRMINADDNLASVFGGRRQVSMFEMTKLVNRHLS